MRIIESSAAGRAGIIGNPSDIYGGFVVACTVAPRNHCRLVFDAEGRRPTDLRIWEAIMNRFPVDPGISVEWTSEVPRSSGLSGSTAMLSSTLLAVLTARNEAPNLDQDAPAFAELVRDIERHEAGIVCGYQDAYVVVHGGLVAMNFEGKHPVGSGPHAQVVGFEAPLPFLLITTGVERLSGSVHGPMIDRWLSGNADVVKGIETIKQLGEKGLDALQRQDWTHLAELMKENHEIIRNLGGSGESIDLLIDACYSSGALSAKLAGAGMGGTVIALSHDIEHLKRELQQRGYSRFTQLLPQKGVRIDKDEDVNRPQPV